MQQHNSPWSSIFILALAGIFMIAFAAITVWIIPYDQLISHIIAVTGKTHLKSALENQYFTPAKFQGLKILLPILCLIAIVVVFLFKERWKRMHILRPILQDIRIAISTYIPNRFSVEWFVLLLLILFIAVKALYYLISSDILYDEAWSYNYYTSGPMYITPFIYSNYPIYEWLTQFFKWLPFPMYINLRLPAFFTGICWLLIVYCAASFLWNKRLALFAVALAGTLPPIALFMLHAKGYLMVVLFSLLLFVVLQMVYNDAWTAKRRRWFVLSIFLGLWSSPIFILPLVITILSYGVLQLVIKKEGDIVLLKLLAIGLLLSLIVYLPVLVGSGIKPLVNAGVLNATAPAHHTMWWHIKFISLWVSGWEKGWWLTLVLFIVSLFLLKRKDKFLGLVTLLSILSIPLVPLIAGSYLYPRIWIFLVVPFALTITAIFQPILTRLPLIIVCSLLVLIINTYSYAYYVERTWSKAWDHTSTQISKLFLKENVKSYYTDFDYLLPIAECYYKLDGATVKAMISNPNSMQYGDAQDMKTTDAVVITKESTMTIPENFSIAYSDSIATVYLRK